MFELNFVGKQDLKIAPDLQEFQDLDTNPRVSTFPQEWSEYGKAGGRNMNMMGH